MRFVLLGLVACGCGGGLELYDKAAAPSDPPEDGSPTTPAPSTDLDTDVDTDSTTPATDTSTDTGTVATVPAWTNGDANDPPPYDPTNMPELVQTAACVDIGTPTSVPDGSGDLTVHSHDDNNETKILDAPTSGWFDLYDFSLANSGFGETNESATIRIINSVVPDGLPLLGNCGAEWVAVDPDNYSDPGTDLVYLGTFWFEQGSNTFLLSHFCPSLRQGICPQLEELADPESDCSSGDDNSVHLDTNGLCLVEPTP